MSRQRHLVRDWPPILPTVEAADYCSTSPWTIQRAVVRGELMPAGVRGRSRVFRREDLDAWMTGSTSKPEPGDPEHELPTAGGGTEATPRRQP